VIKYIRELLMNGVSITLKVMTMRQQWQ